MKNIILLIVLFIPFSLFSQVKMDITSVKADNQTKEWMTKISSDPDMRIKMMEMMLDKTKDNEVEMTKLANVMMSNSSMQKIMMASHPGNDGTQIISVEPRGMKSGNIKTGGMNKTEPMQKK